MTHSGVMYQMDIYFYVLFLWGIAVSDFRPMEIY